MSNFVHKLRFALFRQGESFFANEVRRTDFPEIINYGWSSPYCTESSLFEDLFIYCVFSISCLRGKAYFWWPTVPIHMAVVSRDQVKLRNKIYSICGKIARVYAEPFFNFLTIYAFQRKIFPFCVYVFCGFFVSYFFWYLLRKTWSNSC